MAPVLALVAAVGDGQLARGARRGADGGEPVAGGLERAASGGERTAGSRWRAAWSERRAAWSQWRGERLGVSGARRIIINPGRSRHNRYNQL